MFKTELCAAQALCGPVWDAGPTLMWAPQKRNTDSAPCDRWAFCRLRHLHLPSFHTSASRAEWDPRDTRERRFVIGRYISEQYDGCALHPIDVMDASTGRLLRVRGVGRAGWREGRRHRGRERHGCRQGGRERKGCWEGGKTGGHVHAYRACVPACRPPKCNVLGYASKRPEGVGGGGRGCRVLPQHPRSP
eukprot:278773-Chlamydomonas_euryale.AAC.5